MKLFLLYYAISKKEINPEYNITHVGTHFWSFSGWQYGLIDVDMADAESWHYRGIHSSYSNGRIVQSLRVCVILGRFMTQLAYLGEGATTWFLGNKVNSCPGAT